MSQYTYFKKNRKNCLYLINYDTNFTNKYNIFETKPIIYDILSNQIKYTTYEHLMAGLTLVLIDLMNIHMDMLKLLPKNYFIWRSGTLVRNNPHLFINN